MPKITYFSLINFAAIFAEDKQSGIPPPGWTLPPTQYKFLIDLR
jgi:hypothetical protein